MKLLYDWLREFVDVTAPASELRSRLALSGLAIDSTEESAAGPVLDAEVTANRPDCLGHYGVAREIAAIYRVPVKPLDIPLRESAEKTASATRVDIESPDLCGRFTARILRGVKVQPSPDWLRKRLEAIGQNSINNVVDVTNYVMFELGQPLHAYDLDKLADRRIIVRRARPGEKIRTLDGAERTLAKDMCVIADASRALGIGGVMGGADSEIGFSTRNILLEAACFDPISIRRTSKALGLRTEASYRFERGADPEMAEVASRRAAQLIAELAGCQILAGVVDVYPRREPPIEITLARGELLRVMGADAPDQDIEGILGELGFDPRREGVGPHANWKCRRPSWRQDVSRDIDLIEEVARHYGYDKFPPRLPPAKLPARRLPHADEETRLRECLVALGYNEIVEIPLVDADRDALFRTEGVTTAKIGNPLAEDASILRSNGVVSMLNAVSWNLNHGQRNLRLFEIGKAYELGNGEPIETRILTLGATGLAREKSIHEPAREFTFGDLKGDLDAIGALAGGFAWKSGGPAWLAASRAAQITITSQSSAASANGKLGAAGQLARNPADKLKLRQEIFLAEIKLASLLAGIETALANLKFSPIPRFPAVERDFSLVLAEGIQFSQVADAIRALEIPGLRRIEPADLFRGGQFPAGKYSLMIRVVFQSPDATLTDAQVAAFSSRIVSALEQNLGASLRTT
ncbi:MAG: phenylalanine--tRNA ligase subunit beta [Candidatus Acidiferrales bacterium]